MHGEGAPNVPIECQTYLESAEHTTIPTPSSELGKPIIPRISVE